VNKGEEIKTRGVKDLTPEEIAAYSEYAGYDRIVTFQEKEKELEEAGKFTPAYTLASGLPSLDGYLGGGFTPGNLVVVTGNEKSGKTLWCQSLTMEFLKQESTTIWFQYEVRQEEWLHKFPHGQAPMMGYLPNAMKAHSQDWVEDKILEALVKDEILNGKRTLNVCVIDHIDYIFDFFHTKFPAMEKGQIVRRLKTFANENEMVIILLSHMSGLGDGREPSSRRARDSKIIPAEADKGFAMWRLKEPENNAVIKLDFDRQCGCMQKYVQVVKTQDGYLKEVDLTYQPEGESDKSDWHSKY
jgi:KaiC/GvpD/RAD55 family RecA-like ATPase